MHASPTGNPLHGLEKRSLLHVAEDLSPRAASDVLATLNGHHQVERSSIDRLKRSGPDPSVEIELQPVIRRLEHFQAHAGAELPEQRPVLLSPEVFLFRQRSRLALHELAERE
jgi:hypothetical protein